MSLKQLKGVYTTSKENIRSVKKALRSKNTNNGIVVWIDTNKFWSSDYDAKEIKKKKKKETGFKQSKELYKYGVVEAYRVY